MKQLECILKYFIGDVFMNDGDRKRINTQFDAICEILGYQKEIYQGKVDICQSKIDCFQKQLDNYQKQLDNYKTQPDIYQQSINLQISDLRNK